MAERLDDLQNRGLSIYQDPEDFCFGTDAVLLAHFPALRRGERVVDLGCGGGILPLLMSARRADATFVGLEIQPHLADRARRSVAHNGLTDRIAIHTLDLRQAAQRLGKGGFDLAVCNPPYQPVTAAAPGERESRRIARQEVCCTLADALAAAADLLRGGGRLALVHQPSRMADLMVGLRAVGLEPKRARMVAPAADRAPYIVLIEAVKGARPTLDWMPTLALYGPDGAYTPEVAAIYQGR
ncbi:MAG: tRNA1(Val) (adenine(37)-N6)-methyltransferase [Christensenellales bacterium]|jgi:tRNA1Val (adenine37-N6)-methyltransferase